MNMEAMEALYQERSSAPDQMSFHMGRLRELASECETAVEFGVRRANSSVALLLGVKRQLTSYDIEWPQRYAHLISRIEAAAGPKWLKIPRDSREAEFQETDLLFIDSLHTYDQVAAELRHADRVRKFLVFHDSISHGSIGQDPVKRKDATTWVPNPEVMGIRPAIDHFMIAHRDWRIRDHFTDHSGLLVLER